LRETDFYQKIMAAVVNVRVGVGCFVIDRNHPNAVLIGERRGSHGAGKLALPGGHLELGEAWEDCAKREVKEETNLDIEDIRFVHVTVRFTLSSWCCSFFHLLLYRTIQTLMGY
jgi:ADP-ribose pyrophosphatase YjhB (NUDIX family)